MRLIDADALRLIIECQRETLMDRGQRGVQVLDILHALDAAPTIATTETNNGVTSCRFCGGVVDVEYQEANDE